MFLSAEDAARVPVSVIVPTRNEQDNVAPLLCKLLPVVPDGGEVLFVDDSDDGTPERIHQAAAAHDGGPVRISVAHRRPQERAGGLGTAVVLGLREARNRLGCVMDADLQHPPDTLTRMLVARLEHDADCVVASRYRADGHADGLSGATRGLVSRSSTVLTRTLFPRRLRDVTDPMSGMFLVDRTRLDLTGLRPRGFKILLEVLATTPGLTVAEVGYTFADRHAGDSKASVREGLVFARHVAELRLSRRSRGRVAVTEVPAVHDEVGAQR